MTPIIGNLPQMASRVPRNERPRCSGSSQPAFMPFGPQPASSCHARALEPTLATTGVEAVQT
jgi:PAB1-binding protein PBP1